MAKTFDQFLSESGRQSELDDLRRTGRYDAARSQYESTGGYGSSGGGGGGGGNSGASTGNLNSIIADVSSMVRSQYEPITKQLESIKPLISQSIQQKKTTLEGRLGSLTDRYQKLLQDITTRGKEQETTQTRITNSELAKRGITGDSTAAVQEIANVLKPIQDQSTSNIKDVDLAQKEEERGIQDAIGALPGEQAMAEADILRQVASILAGGVNQSIGLGSTIYSTNQAQQQAQQAADRQSQETSEYRALQNRLLQQQLTQQQSLAPLQLQQLQAEIAKLTKPSSGGGLSSGALSGFW